MTPDHMRSPGLLHSVDETAPLLSRRACVGYSLLAMAIWPLLAFPLAFGKLDSPGEASLLLGGLTTLAIVIPFMAASTNLDTLMVFIHLAIYLVWAIAWLMPPMLLGGRLRTPRAIALLLGIQSCFAFIQAGVGVLALYGKSI